MSIVELCKACFLNDLLKVQHFLFNDVEEVIDKIGADVWRAAEWSQGNLSPLHIACCTANEEIFKTLLDAGANVNQVSSAKGSLPLTCILFKTDRPEVRARMARTLLDKGADPLFNKGVNEGRIPVDFARANNRNEYIQMFETHIARTSEAVPALPQRGIGPSTRSSVEPVINQLKEIGVKEEMVKRAKEKQSELVRLETERDELKEELANWKELTKDTKRKLALNKARKEKVKMQEGYLDEASIARLADDIAALRDLGATAQAVLGATAPAIETGTSGTNPGTGSGDSNCLVCLEVPTGPIFSCETCENLICEACKDGLNSKCPTCRQTANFRRNRLAERILRQ